MSMRGAIVLAVLIISATSACSSADEPMAEPSPTQSSEATTPQQPESASSSAPPTPSPSPTDEGPVLAVSLSGSDIRPNAEEIDIASGEPLLVRVNSDRAGELHVHSKPEQVLKFDAGKSTQELIIETPGLVEIEEHDTGAVVARLSVGG